MLGFSLETFEINPPTPFCFTCVGLPEQSVGLPHSLTTGFAEALGKTVSCILDTASDSFLLPLVLHATMPSIAGTFERCLVHGDVANDFTAK